MWQDVVVTGLAIVATVVCVLVLMVLGWYVVWQLFLSKFKFLRELVGEASAPPAEPQPSEAEAERPATVQTRSRLRTARQRVAFPENTS
ncbi:small integral membrane protein 13 [Synchiropus splendidus]|uniref:small integral membrane protein 13 n=1 Tax=Synchiropus splendidus TaxID=270530 RepID=UPI00237D77E3|nr:small integral membrane protein 13 [Synchiropus splendidus]